MGDNDNQAAVVASADANNSSLLGTPSSANLEFIRDQDRLLPIANVARIMKDAVPANAKISKEAKETVQECVSEFIAFVTSEAGERCQQEKRKTINGEDIIWAMETLGFDNYASLMKSYLQKFKETMKHEKGVFGYGSGRPSGEYGAVDEQQQQSQQPEDADY